MPNSLSIVQFTALILSLLATVLQVVYLRQHKRGWGISAPWVIFTLHIFLYYSALAVAVYDLPLHTFIEGLDGPLLFQNWSAAIRLQALLTVTGITLIKMADER